MDFGNEAGKITDNLKDFVTGDFDVAGQKIPKIIPVGIVVGVVGYLGYRASKNKQNNTSLTDSSNGSLNTPKSSDGALDGATQAGNTAQDLIDNLPTNDINASPFPIGDLPALFGDGFNSTLPDTYQLPVTPEYNGADLALPQYNYDVPIMSSNVNPVNTIDNYGQTVSVPSNVLSRVQKAITPAQLNNRESVAGTTNRVFNNVVSKPVNNLNNALGSKISSKPISNATLTPAQKALNNNIIQPLNKVINPIQNLVNSLNIFNKNNNTKPVSATPINNNGLFGSGKVLSSVIPTVKVSPVNTTKPIVTSVKPPQVTVNKPVVVSKPVTTSSNNSGLSKVKTLPVPKVYNKPVVLR